MNHIYYILLIAIICCNLTSPGLAQDTNEEDLISIIGTGDIMLGSNYPSDAKLPANDGKDLFREVREILTDADVTFGNLEGCFLNKGGNAKSCKGGCYFFRMPDRYVNYLVEAGYDVMSIANNHAGDFGAPGRENTQKVLKTAGIHYAGLKGVCETSRFEKNGVKYGFAAFAPNTGTVSIKDIPAAKMLVSGLSRECDIVIVSFHGGAEGKTHNRVPKKTETFYGENRGDVYAFSHAVIDAGADIVFGHGPHVARAAELYNDRFIIYSLGNFCTAGDFSISGISGYAPIVKVYTDKEGKFVKGHIYSAIQKDKTGPVMDANYAAAKEIKRLTGLDFPATGILISNEGAIEKKKDPLAAIEKFSANLRFKVELPPGLGVLKLPAVFDADSANRKKEFLARDIIEYSKKYLNRPYRRGTRGPNTFDCSGFTHHVFKHFGYDLNAGCTSQIHQGMKIRKEELKTGDLIFFKGRNAKSARVGHVGIVVSNDNGSISFIHACHRGVIIEELEKSAYYKPRYVTGLRVIG
ncbi:MAG: CapA family protein [Tannerella sp.]|jgi:poly-gamma-glutamate capsule biosynthesis protein CapA/YwtB (metallophosphatase superfamily)|nr:CapA family protein [Tannerella sp.]